MNAIANAPEAVSLVGPDDFQHVDPDSVFEIRLDTIPLDAQPIWDDDLRAIVGFRRERFGLYTIYGLDGAVVEEGERGLEQPLIDPIDLMFLGPGLLRLVGKTVTTAPRVLAGGAAMLAGKTILRPATIATLRMLMRSLYLGELRFAASALRHMGERGRYVPIHILRLAIRHGRREADPGGAANAWRYVIRMKRQFFEGAEAAANAGRTEGIRTVEYELEVVVRHTDNTILHFLYK